MMLDSFITFAYIVNNLLISKQKTVISAYYHEQKFTYLQRFLMQLINLIIIFVVCLALALFSIENPEFAQVQLIPGMELQAPISIEFIFAIGLGAVLAWMFSVWANFQQFLASSGKIRIQNKRIKELESQLENHQADSQSSVLSLPEAEDTKVAVENS